MITPSYSTTATERVLPRLALDFTTAVADARVSVARANNTATRINASGAPEIVNANLPRLDFDPATLVCKGLLVEEARTNLLLNSLINGTDLITQSVTLLATAYTLSFYGTGSIAISGGHSATVAGSGAYPSRKTYTFTPTAGSTTFTVSGVVQYAQLEAGAFATSFIPTAGSSVLRNADVPLMSGTNFSSWYNGDEGAFICAFSSYAPASAANRVVFQVSNGSFQNFMWAYTQTNTGYQTNVITGGATQVAVYPGAYTTGNSAKTGFAYKLNSFAAASDGANLSTDATVVIPTVSQVNLGCQTGGGLYINGHIQKFSYWPQRITNAEVVAFSK